MIACFHLKRFEHTVFNKRKKIHSVIRFPEEIDLTPYTTAYCKKLKLNGACKDDSPVDLLSRSSNKYVLLIITYLDLKNYTILILSLDTNYFPLSTTTEARTRATILALFVTI